MCQDSAHAQYPSAWTWRPCWSRLCTGEGDGDIRACDFRVYYREQRSSPEAENLPRWQKASLVGPTDSLRRAAVYRASDRSAWSLYQRDPFQDGAAPAGSCRGTCIYFRLR
ncbi:hypothetical protein NDU88_008913 [Pleurodeles waltl]|uniref:Uncharacterized protein n=1 Tax=Pleurodeles waltl TaxID=8319 RepID=A0AAV7N7V4_PLEWA|nr:hypothetical protein NDU88_008913 [Pleurodeles waltl]